MTVRGVRSSWLTSEANCLSPINNCRSLDVVIRKLSASSPISFFSPHSRKGIRAEPAFLEFLVQLSRLIHKPVDRPEGTFCHPEAESERNQADCEQNEQTFQKQFPFPFFEFVLGTGQYVFFVVDGFDENMQIFSGCVFAVTVRYSRKTFRYVMNRIFCNVKS